MMVWGYWWVLSTTVRLQQQSTAAGCGKKQQHRRRLRQQRRGTVADIATLLNLAIKANLLVYRMVVVGWWCCHPDDGVRTLYE